MREVSEGDRIAEQNALIDELTAFQIEDVAAPVRAPKIVKPKKLKPKIKVSDALRNAAKAYKAAYKHVYHMEPRLTFDGTWVRLPGQKEGISLKRLKELTTQLRARA